MPFTNIFSLSGQKFTYRDFWALTLGSYAGLVIITGILVSVLTSRYSKSPNTTKDVGSGKKRSKVIAGVTGFFYSAIMFLLALATGLFVFGGSSFMLFLGVLIGVQLIFGLIGVFVKVPYMGTMIILVSNWYIAGSIWFLIQLPSMFDYAPSNLTWLTAVFSAIPFAIMGAITYIKFTVTDKSLSWKSRLGSCLKRWGLWVFVTIAVAVGVVLAFFLAGTCVTVYDPNANGSWIPFAGTLRWNSRMMRSFSPNPCPGPGPCHVYLTAGSDLSTEMFVNVHMPLGSTKSMNVTFTNSEGQQVTVHATEFDVPLIDKHDDRLVFSAYLSNLRPGSEVSFTLLSDSGEKVGEDAYYFKTASSNGALNFVVAGDGGLTDYTTRIMEQMISKRPLVGFIGGDVAYDNGLLSCACVWDGFLSAWESQRVDDKFLVPLSLAIGNHDIGLNDNNADAFARMSTGECNPEYIVNARPLFYAWFPYEAVDSQVLAVCQRSAVRRHTNGKTNVWMLDTAYTMTAKDNVDFVNSKMLAGGSDAKVNFAVYHVPLYAANKADANQGGYLRETWPSGIFDKYNFKACFENHAHAFKRTKPLVNNTVVASGGTVYLGDGKMGVDGLSVPDEALIIKPSDTNVFAVTGTEFHFFSVSIDTDGKTHIDAVNEDGVVFDSQDL
jgi:hypothetical protein